MQLIKVRHNDNRVGEFVYIPVYPSDEEESNKIPEGKEMTAKRSRNPDHHRKAFAMLKLGFENQDRYDDFEMYRMIMIMKAGYVHSFINLKGEQDYLPKSLSFESMSQDEFEECYRALRKVISVDCKSSENDIDAELINFM